MKRAFVAVMALSLLLSLVPVCGAQDKPPQTTGELEQSILKVLRETHTPGLAAAIVTREGPRWTAGIGSADVAARRPVTPDTLFRIGSVSKSFVALSVLKLQREGKLNLNDAVRKIAPEIQFNNPWEATEPVRVVNLLEHTAGFDDLHLPEYANNDAKPLTLREGLDLHPHSRTVRWRPGTRFSYANSGPAVAAYLVEKVSGKRFEDYVTENFFRPLQMNTATYFLPSDPNIMTKLYREDGQTSYPYWHIVMRPAGSINASAREMANYVQMYLNRGRFGETTIVAPEDLDRMETPATTYAAREGMRLGYGLNNYSEIEDGFVYHGHDGGVAGGLTNLAYLPDQGIGYVFMINSGSGQAFQRIAKLIRGYITRGLQKPALPAPGSVPEALAMEYSGYYEPISPRAEMTRFMERIMGIRRVTLSATELQVRPLLGKAQRYYATSDRLFRKDTDPQPTLALIADRSEGTLIQTMTTFRRISTWFAFAEIGGTAITALLVISALLFALVWIPRKLLGRMRDVQHLSVRAWPLISILCLAAAAVLMVISNDEWASLQRFAAVTPWSFSVFLLTIAFAVTALVGLVVALRVRRSEIRPLVYIHSLATSIALTVLEICLTYWGVVGVRTWA